MFEWQAAEPFLVAGSQTVKCAVCEHTSTLAHQRCSDSQYCHVCAGMCPQQQSRVLHWLLKASFALQIQKYTPSNTIYTCKLQGM